MKPLDCSELNTNYDINLTNGLLSHCCKFKPITFNPAELDQLGHRYFDLNSQTIQARQDLAAGIQTSRCSDCWEHEAKNLVSWRLLKSNRPANELYFNVQLNSLCNQACYYCIPASSTTIAKYGTWIDSFTADPTTTSYNKDLPAINFQHVIDFIKNTDSTFEKLNLSISGGEPFMLENFENNLILLVEVFLSAADNRQALIAVSTNTNTKTDKLLKFYERIKQSKFRRRLKINIISSIENIEERAEYVRDGLVWSNFEENFKIHYAMADKLTVRLTVNPFTVVKIVDFFKYFSRYSRVSFNYNYPFQKFFRMDILDRRFINELEQLEEYIIDKNIGERFEKEFYKFLPDMLKNDKDNARLFKKAITHVDKIKNRNWQAVFPEYIPWFDSIE